MHFRAVRQQVDALEAQTKATNRTDLELVDLRACVRLVAPRRPEDPFDVPGERLLVACSVLAVVEGPATVLDVEHP